MGPKNIMANSGCILVPPLPNFSGNTGVMVCMNEEGIHEEPYASPMELLIASNDGFL